MMKIVIATILFFLGCTTISAQQKADTLNEVNEKRKKVVNDKSDKQLIENSENNKNNDLIKAHKARMRKIENNKAKGVLIRGAEPDLIEENSKVMTKDNLVEEHKKLMKEGKKKQENNKSQKEQ